MRAFDAIENSIIYAYRGSIAHNLRVDDTGQTDDTDLMGVCIAPIDYYFGIRHFEQYEQLPSESDDRDIVVYDIKKYFRLLLKANPNVISLLWNHPSHYIKITELGQRLIDNRHIFNSQLSFKSFHGYAYSQLKKMTHGAYRGYMGAKRKKLVDKFGVVGENASHLIRLLIMGTEFLNTGEFTVYREHDRDFLLSIKLGEYSMEQIQRMADKYFIDIKVAKAGSKLPKEPDYSKANELLISIMQDYFSN